MTDQKKMHVDITLRDAEGEEHAFEMPITWGAARRLAEIGVSPNAIAAGLADTDQVVMARVIHIGITEAGADPKKWTEDIVGEVMINEGFLAFELPVGLYLGGFSVGGITTKAKKAVTAAAIGSKKKPSTRGHGSKSPTSSQSGRGASSRRSSGTSRSRSGGGSTKRTKPASSKG